MDKLIIGGKEFTSRLFVGTGKFRSNEHMATAIKASGSQMVTVAMKRIDMDNREDDMLRHIVADGIQLLPNTSGVRDAEEAVLAAQLAREAFGTNFIKLEIHPDPRYLLPDPVETLKATEKLAEMGFVVLPYIQADPVLCKRLEDAGAATVMPLAAPIGSNKGLVTRDMLRIIIEQSRIPVVVDAGLGAPSHAAEAMEMGADAVLVNTAIAVAGDPVRMARAFAAATASNTTDAGSDPSCPPISSACERFAHSFNCSPAAARNVSAAASTTFFPCAFNFPASFPTDVVFPTPLTPTISTTDFSSSNRYAVSPTCICSLMLSIRSSLHSSGFLMWFSFTFCFKDSKIFSVAETPISPMMRISSISS